jgi:hypothetical protein
MNDEDLIQIVAEATVDLALRQGLQNNLLVSNDHGVVVSICLSVENTLQSRFRIVDREVVQSITGARPSTLAIEEVTHLRALRKLVEDGVNRFYLAKTAA